MLSITKIQAAAFSGPGKTLCIPCMFNEILSELEGPNEILSKYSPTGMAQGGVAASDKQAEQDELKLTPELKKSFNETGEKYGFPPALLAGIASRESRMGSGLDSNGWGDHGNAFGIMQVDKNANPVVRGQTSIDSLDHLDQAAQNLKNKLAAVEAHHADWPEERKLQRAVALYNGDSSGKSHTLDNMDEGTTGGDYSNDVWARSQVFAKNW